MTRFLALTLALTAALVGLMAASGDAAPNELVWDRDYASLQNPVEQQTCDGGFNEPDCPPELWVTNRTGCPWDVDDHIEARASARLRPGESIGGNECLIGDAWHRIAVAGCVGVNGDALVRLEVRTPPAVISVERRGSPCAIACIVGPAYPYESVYMQEIEGSNGGRGVVATLTASVTNAGKGRKDSRVSLVLKHRSLDSHCRGVYPADFECVPPTPDGPLWCERP